MLIQRTSAPTVALVRLAVVVTILTTIGEAQSPGSLGESNTGVQNLIVTDLRALAIELARRFPEEATQLRKIGSGRDRLTTLRTWTLREVFRRSGNRITQYTARVEVSAYPSLEMARIGLATELKRYPLPFTLVETPLYGEVCYERSQQGYFKAVIFLRRNVVVNIRYLSPETFDVDPDTGRATTEPVRERDLLTDRKCDELAAFIDQFLIRAQ